MNAPRVVITGIGAVTPLGNTLRETRDAALLGKSGVTAIRRFNADWLRWKIAGELNGFEPLAFLSG